MSQQPIIIKKVKGHAAHAHHGGSWKVAYADFVTAMMAFFMVMWLMGLSDETRAQIQGYFNDPLGFSKDTPKTKTLISIKGIPSSEKSNRTKKQGAKTDAAVREFEDMKKLQKQIVSTISNDPSMKDLLKGFSVEVTPEGLLIELAEVKGAVFFESGSSEIRQHALGLIAKLAPILAGTKHPLWAQGHTDAEPFTGPAGNSGLSSDRARSLAGALITDGVADTQITRIEGLGSTKLLDPDHPLAFCNRRVTILLPRKYKEGDKEEMPADQLKSEISGNSNPDAVEVKPIFGRIAGPASK